MFLATTPWSGRRYFLDKMTLRELVWAFVTYPAIQAYALLTVVSLGLAVYWGGAPLRLLAAVAATLLIYPLVEYLLHRFLLHGRLLYRSRHTAALWKRIHFDHHQDPNDLAVLFGAPHTTLPPIFLIAGSLGWLIAGPGGAALSVATALVLFCLYEFVHCVQHLPFKPKLGILRRMKQRHLAHHFHSEHGNFGITSSLWDRVFGTYYADPKAFPRSETVFNLGYTASESERFPWVATLSGLVPGAPVLRRGRQE